METPKRNENTAKIYVELTALTNNLKNLQAVTRALSYCNEELPDNACRCMELVNQELERATAFLTSIVFPDLNNENDEVKNNDKI